MPVPPDWSVRAAADGIRLATPVPLRLLPGKAQEPGFDLKIYQADHDGVRYQVSVSNEPRAKGRVDFLAVFFESVVFNKFAESAALRRNGPTERLTVAGWPAAQASFTDGTFNAVVRAVHLKDRAVTLTAFTKRKAEERDPAIGPFLNSVRISK